MSSLSSTTLFSQNYLFLHLHSRKLLLHIPLHQNPEANPPVPSNHHDALDPISGQSTFDANVVIVLSLLVCGLICSIGVNFMVRCALRCIRSPERNSAQIQNTGVEKKALKTFKTVKYSEEIKVELPGLNSECVICLSEFKNGEKVRILPKCNHGFHVQCIDKWLGLHSTCPTCRTSQKFVPTPGLDSECVICLLEFGNGEKLGFTQVYPRVSCVVYT